MKFHKSLFDESGDEKQSEAQAKQPATGQLPETVIAPEDKISHKEATPLERLRNLDSKIADAIDKVKGLKEDKAVLEAKVKELERALSGKNEEIERLRSEKSEIKGQIEDLLSELDAVQLNN